MDVELKGPFLLLFDQDCHGFDFHEQILTTETGLNPDAGRERIQPEPPEESRADAVKVLVVTLDISQIAGAFDDIAPTRALSPEKRCDVAVGTPALSSEITDVNVILFTRAGSSFAAS